MPNEELEKQVEQFEQDLNTGKKKDKKSTIKYILNISLVLIGTFLAIFLSLKDNFKEVVGYLAKCDVKYLLIVVGIMFAISLIKGLVYYCFARLYTKNYKYHQGLVIDQVGIFYNAVTPGASGGQIMQAYTFKRQGLPISNAVSIMAMYSIVFQSVLIVYGTVAFIVKYDFIISIGNLEILGMEIGIWPLTIIGFLLNVSVIALVLLMGYWRSFHNFVMGPCINLGARLHLIKDPDKSRENLRIQVENFKIELRRLFTNIPILILVTFLVFVAMTIRFSAPWFIGMALGNDSEVAKGFGGFWESVILSNYHQMVTGCIPLPGSAGISELFFKILFFNKDNAAIGFYYDYVEGGNSLQASENMCKAALILWRTITFTIPLIFAGIVSAFYHPKAKGQQDQQILPSRETFVQLQNETYAERAKEVEQLEQTSELTLEAIRKRMKALNKKQNENKTDTLNNIRNKLNNHHKKEKDNDNFYNVDIDNGDDSI